MASELPPGTRVVPASSVAQWTVRSARLKVTRGPDKGKQVTLGELRRAIIGTHPDAELCLSDDTISRRHAELRLEDDAYVLRDLGSTNGIRVGGVRIREAVLENKVPVISLGETELQFVLGNDEVRQPLGPGGRFQLLVGASLPMRSLFALLERAAAVDSTVLVEGESGTGKELVAESLHRASSRAAAPLVVMDCASIPAHLVESELFGHVKGAFTGAVSNRVGLFEQAHGGTLFLDEIGDLPLDAQPRLLRALESAEVRPIGAAGYRAVDVRIVAATHRNLERLVEEGRFREDLYHRLAVLRVEAPPLRERRGDVTLLARCFIEALRPGIDPEQLLTPAIAAALEGYAWPGNVRELKNTIERLLAVGELATAVGTSRKSDAGPVGDYSAARRAAIDRFEREYCVALLDDSGGSTSRAAEHAGISRQMFHHLMKKHELRGR